MQDLTMCGWKASTASPGLANFFTMSLARLEHGYEACEQWREEVLDTVTSEALGGTRPRDCQTLKG